MDRLLSTELGAARVWATPSVASRVAARMPFPRIGSLEELDVSVRTLVVVGGGAMIDEAKHYVATERSDLRLVVVPSIWGSGAEASPIVVLDRPGGKVGSMDQRFLPAVRVEWPELAATIPESRAREACGDVWSHALEGFLSPLASRELRASLVELIREMLAMPLARDLRWFELSRRACRLQSESSVGLIHGIAHVLEPALAAALGRGWGHARLCAIFFRPVWQFDRAGSESVERLLIEYALEAEEISSIADKLFDREHYQAALPALRERWETVLRDPCSRTNCRLVRRGHLDFFLEAA